MPSTYTPSLRFTLQATGEGLNVWGGILNSGVFSLVDYSIAGRAAFSLSGSKTLISNNGATDEARAAMLDITSGSGGTITIPAVSKMYLVRNGASGNVVITTGGGSTITVRPGESLLVFTDGTDVRSTFSTDFMGNRITNVGAPISSNDAATKVYVDTTAWNLNSGILPGQGGNASLPLVTDGTTPSWTQLTGLGLADGAITTPKILDANVTEAKVATGAITNAKLGALAVTAAKIDTGAVTTSKIANGNVTAAKLDTGAAVANIGYTPINKAGDTVQGNLGVNGYVSRALPALASTASSVATANVAEASVGSNGIRVRDRFQRLANGTDWTTSAYETVLDVDGTVQHVVRLDPISTGRFMTILNEAGIGLLATFFTNGDFTAVGTVTANSDVRLKKDITPITGALDLVSAMQGVRWTWKDGRGPGIGLIAQDVEPLVPEAVRTDPVDDSKSIGYGNLVGVLVEAIKELRQRVEHLEQELAAG